MKLFNTFLALAALSTAALTSCTSNQQKSAIDFAVQTVNDLSGEQRFDAQLANQIKLGLEVASRLDLSAASAAALLNNARLAVSTAQAAGAMTPDQALVIRTGLNAVQLLVNSLQSETAALPADRRPSVPQPQLTTILPRREASRLHRSEDIPVRFIAVA